jgi:hypothetical protein
MDGGCVFERDTQKELLIKRSEVGSSVGYVRERLHSQKLKMIYLHLLLYFLRRSTLDSDLFVPRCLSRHVGSRTYYP